MAIETWMPTLAETYAAVEGIEQVHPYDKLPAKIAVFPSLILLPTRSAGASYPMVTHQIQATLYLAAQVLPEAYALAVPFIERMRRAVITHSQLGGAVAEWYLPADWYEGPGGVTYADATLCGIIFRSIIKEQETTNAQP